MNWFGGRLVIVYHDGAHVSTTWDNVTFARAQELVDRLDMSTVREVMYHPYSTAMGQS